MQLIKQTNRDPNCEKPDPTNREHVLLVNFLVSSNNQELRKLIIKIDPRGNFISIKNLLLYIYGRRHRGNSQLLYQVRASSEPHFGALREGGGTREAGSTVAESLVVLYRVGTHQIWRRWRAARLSTSHGRAEPLCARITGA